MGYNFGRPLSGGATVVPPQIACGVDIIEVDRIRNVIARRGAAFLNRCYSESELSSSGGRPEALAARFAAKEACLKALGTGLRGMKWRDVEVISAASGEPELALRGAVKREAERQGWGRPSVSLSHTKQFAVAVVAAVRMVPKPE